MPANSARVFFKVLVVLVVLAAAAGGAIYYSRPVAKVEAVTRGDAANIVPGSVVVDERIAPISSEVEGKIRETTLVPGQVVKEGEVLAQLDTTDIDLEIAQARAEYETASANAKITRETAELEVKSAGERKEAIESEHKLNKMAEVDYKKALRDLEMAQHTRDKAAAEEDLRVATRENTLKVAQRKKEKMAIRAPFDGTITQVLAGKNDLIGAKQPIANIIALTRRVRAKISEEKFAQVQPGQKAKVTFLGYQDQVFNATVTEKLPAPEPDTQRYSAYLKVDIAPDQLLPALTGEVGIVVGEHRNVLRVPRRAMWDGYVYVVAGGRVHEQKVDTGFVDYNFVEITGGVKEGDLVIVEELENFHDRQRVRPVGTP